jgi:hypothetical protein
MQEFIAKYRDEIQGTLSGFDRVVFAGSAAQTGLQPLGAETETAAGYRHGAISWVPPYPLQGLRRACQSCQ